MCTCVSVSTKGSQLHFENIVIVLLQRVKRAALDNTMLSRRQQITCTIITLLTPESASWRELWSPKAPSGALFGCLKQTLNFSRAPDVYSTEVVAWATKYSERECERENEGGNGVIWRAKVRRGQITLRDNAWTDIRTTIAEKIWALIFCSPSFIQESMLSMNISVKCGRIADLIKNRQRGRGKEKRHNIMTSINEGESIGKSKELVYRLMMGRYIFVTLQLAWPLRGTRIIEG